jgi:serine protease
LALGVLWSVPAHADRGGGAVSYLPPVGKTKPHRTTGTTNLTYHGGSIQSSTKIYISFWGPEWNDTSFSQSAGGQTYTYATAMHYITSFFGGVGGSNWITPDNQYCMSGSVTLNTSATSCPTSGVTAIGNSATEYAGSWIDTTAVPSNPGSSDILAAAQRAQAHFGDYSGNASYLVFTPSGKSESGFANSWCAWHTSYGSLAYGYVPFMPDGGSSCGMNFINSTDTAFGNGYYDGFSITAGHEYEEMQTDPYPSSGWVDGSGNEDADKCAWNGMSSDISLGGNSFAVQPVWSNAVSGCVLNK